jgi:phospholipid/cholesterol/gamma-HCH transport system permease protein
MKTLKKEGTGGPISISLGEKGEARLALAGRIGLDDLTSLTQQVGALFAKNPTRLTVDLSRLEEADSGGGLFLLWMEDEARRRSIPFEFLDMPQRVRGILDLLDRDALRPAPPPAVKSENLFEAVGKATAHFFGDIGQTITFGGTLLSEVVLSILHPSSVRWKDVIVYMKKVGVDGLPILALISFLMGLIMAFMSSLQLKQFGANSYVASLVAIAMVRELGPIITAILVAGRSGSAFAAEIGTMVVNEEVDSLATMGFSPIRFLAVPKVLAAAVMVPLLTFFSDLFAIIGGMCVGILGLGLTFRTYEQYTSWAITITDVMNGVIKSFAFAVLIASIGCQRGFAVRGGAQAVGDATTSAVVSGLFLIILTDSTFAIIFNYVKW